MVESLSRKEKRKLEQQWTTYGNMKKTAAVLGTTVTAVSVVAPLFPAVTVHAEDADTQIVASTETSEETASTETVDMETETSQVEEDSTTIEDTAPETAISEEAENTYTEETLEEEVTEPEVQEAPTEEAITPFAATTFATTRFAKDPATFIAEIASYAKPVAEANDLYASVMIAQAALESGWGQSSLSSAPNYNLFGIKGSYNGQSVTMSTQEFTNNQWITINAAFRKYPSYSESFQDNATVLRTTSFQSGVYYYSGAWKSNTTSYREATAYLTGRYATAPTYASSLNTIIEQYNLTQYDTPASGKPSQGNNGGTNTTTPSSPNSNGSSAGSSTYTVKSGDSIWLIANNHGISMNNLRSWNNISGDFIYPGQKLVVKKGSTTNNSNKPTTSKPATKPSNNGNSSKNTTYTVKSGDSIWLIANNHGISMNDLRSWNNISGDFIYPGQKLVVKKGSTTNNSSKPTTSKPATKPSNNGNSSKNTTYTVKSGDSIWLIANNHGISMNNLRSWNNISGDFIYPGQKLVVKKGSTTNNSNKPTTSKPATKPSNNGNSSKNTTYTVKSGDSIWLIANNHGISMNNLRSWNNISGDFIYPGQKLTVKKGATSSAKNNATKPKTSNNRNYQVKSGDSLWLISEKYGVSISHLKSLNKLSSDIIYVGQTLKVS